MKILVVGAGFAGATIARQAAELGHKIDVIDKRSHIAGNAYDYVNEYGIRVHKYGPHLFHTSNENVINWLSQFTIWTPYEHFIKALLKDGTFVPFPVNLNTLEIVPEKDVFKIFFEPYSKKMWGDYFTELDKEVLQRVKIKDSRDNRCFQDTFQAIPTHGYEILFANMLSHPNINITLNQKFDRTFENDYNLIFNSMGIDEYYEYEHGPLPYRTLLFETVTLPFPKILPSPVVNFTHDGPCTRVTEWKQIDKIGNEHYTTLTFETPIDGTKSEEKYYPVLTTKNKDLYKQYKNKENKKTVFIGRCGQYLYMDMHMVVSSSLNLVKKTLQ